MSLKQLCRKIVAIPKGANTVDHEVELGLVVGKQMDQNNHELQSSISGYVIALDLTDRNLQQKLKTQQLPWCLAKCFDTSCPIGSLLPLNTLPTSFLQDHPYFSSVTSEIWLSVNNKERQRSPLNLMIWPPSELIRFIVSRITLEPGDIILTGTPVGVGPIKNGDKIVAGLDDVYRMHFTVK